MAYIRTTWVESETPLSAQNMNNIEDGIEELQEQKVDKVNGKALSDNNYTTAEKTKLAGIAANAEVNVQSDWSQSDSSADDFIKNKPGNATTSAAGLMSAADKTKLNGIATGAEVNQNAFSNVKVGSTTVAADGKTDTLELVAGSNVTLTPDATNDKVTIAATNTTYSDATTSAHGLMTAADKTKLNGVAAGAQVNSITGVKGGAESSYRTGNVNITPANIGSYAKAESLTLGTVVSKSFTTTDQTYTLTSDAYVYFGGTSTSRVEVLQVNCLINGTIVACQSVYLDSLGTDAPVYSSILLKKGTQIQYKKIPLVDFTGATDSVSLKICPIS